MEVVIRDVLKSKNIQNIELTGFKKGDELLNEISGAVASILPSIWPETFGLTILESFAQKKPVIGSRIGGIQEIIVEDENGLLFDAGNEHDLKSKIELMFAERNSKAIEMGEKGFKDLKNKFGSNSHYQSILKIYNDLLKK